MPTRRERTVEYGLLGDDNGNVRLPASDLVMFRLATGTGRPQIGRLSRVETGEVVYSGGVYSAGTATPPEAGQACLVERTSGRAPGGWRVVAITPSTGA